jgi:hypothetical protein
MFGLGRARSGNGFQLSASGAVKPFFYVCSGKQMDNRTAMGTVSESTAFLHEFEKLLHFHIAEILASLYGCFASH